MHCRNCNNKVADIAVLCMGCGCPPMAGNNFCHQCGSETPLIAEICVKCGVSLKAAQRGRQKTKITAVLLAVFFGVWGWIYTLDRSREKFYIGLGGQAIAFLLYVASYVAGMVFHETDFSAIYLLGGLSVTACFWIWAVVDIAIKPSTFYTMYPD